MKARLYLPDTNLFSRFLRGLDLGLCKRVDSYIRQMYLSAVVWAELRYGAEKRRDLPQIGVRLAQLRVRFPDVEVYDERAAAWTGYIRAYLANLKPNAQPIGAVDCMIAGHALALGATLITHNTGEFSRIPNLEIEDWQGLEV